MDTIRTYIDNLFLGLPESQEILRAKKELGAVMEDKYNELKSLGKSENEAIGIVISEFGNIDELLKELQISKDSTKMPNSERKQVKLIDKTTVESYLAVVKKNAFSIPLGVFMILFGVVLLLLIGGVEIENLGTESVMNTRMAMGISAMLVTIIIGVICIVFNALQLNEFTVFNLNFKLSSEAETYTQELYKSFAPRKFKGITIGVCIILISVLVVIMGALFGGGSTLAVTLSVSAMLILIGIGTGILINTGLYMTAYDRLLMNIERNSGSIKKSERLVEAIGGGYWCLVVAIYLLISFITHEWGTTWIIWPVAAMIFGGIAAVINSVVKD